MHLWPLPHPSNLVRMINWLGKFLTTSRMENQNKDCWLIEKWKKLWTDEIIALEVYIPTMQNSLFGQWVTGWPDYLDSQLHPCLPILSSWKVTTSLLWYVVSSGIVQVISQMEFISQGALGCSPDQRAYYRTVVLQPPFTDSHHHCLPNQKVDIWLERKNSEKPCVFSLTCRPK